MCGKTLWEDSAMNAKWKWIGLLGAVVLAFTMSNVAEATHFYGSYYGGYGHGHYGHYGHGHYAHYGHYGYPVYSHSYYPSYGHYGYSYPSYGYYGASYSY